MRKKRKRRVDPRPEYDSTLFTNNLGYPGIVRAIREFYSVPGRGKLRLRIICNIDDARELKAKAVMVTPTHIYTAAGERFRYRRLQREVELIY